MINRARNRFFEALETAHQALSSGADDLYAKNTRLAEALSVKAEELAIYMEAADADLREGGDDFEEGLDLELAFGQAYANAIDGRMRTEDLADHLRHQAQGAGFDVSEISDALLLEDAEAAYNKRRGRKRR
jgi:hypothetical protein